jgi:hypothetical protein
MARGFTQYLTEMNTRNLAKGKAWAMRRADNLSDIFEPIVQKMLDPRRLKTL